MKSFFLTPEQYGDLKGRYAKFNEPWTAEDTEELKQMAADGVSREEMSRQLGRTPNAVKMKLQSLGLYIPKPAAKPWTPADEDALVKMYREGASFATLAATFGRSERAVISRLILLRAGVTPAEPAESTTEVPATADPAAE